MMILCQFYNDSERKKRRILYCLRNASKKIKKMCFYALRLFSEYYILVSTKLKITTYRFKD